MSAVDVMYHQPYSSNLAYYPRTPIEQAFGLTKLHEPMNLGCYSAPGNSILSVPVTSSPPHNLHLHQSEQQVQPQTHPNQHLIPESATSTPPHVNNSIDRSCNSSSSSSSLEGNAIKEENNSDKGTVPKETVYLASNSMVHNYFSGDSNRLVDEHFLRALSHYPGYSSTSSHGSSMSPSDRNKISPFNKDSLSMSQRNFPPSFWNPSYHQNNNLESAAAYLESNALSFNPASPYFSSATLHGISSLHQAATAAAVAAADPWHYSLSPHAQSTYRPTPTTAHVHYDLSYSSMAAAAASSRFASSHGQYGSLLMPHHPVPSSQPPTAAAMRSAGSYSSMHSQACDISGKSAADLPTTARRFADYPSHSSIEAGLAGVENPVSDTGKDMYWY
ncbi:transcription cofactor vestigial-like protein 2 isoform X1 [Octopus bimaculoides]|uniref:Transcription cofactor vestigial-like protein 2 n=2 Tax=Octopus bimaculoides TaxID=37653 RepID=A0A0L8HNR2_OCTBM|nr:transcription cofactor vestigial-like protein 2 isoform X1 [Octopus bimaculoides]|eukprot:XP_014770775.1 PREDICTED: transcription cofactor vestigial-like protein 2 isoform X1 [Octopus bimaculoides]